MRLSEVSMAFLVTAVVIVATPGTGAVYTIAVPRGQGRTGRVAGRLDCGQDPWSAPVPCDIGSARQVPHTLADVRWMNSSAASDSAGAGARTPGLKR